MAKMHTPKPAAKLIIDTRTPDQFMKGSVEGAKNIPFRNLQKDLLMVNRSTHIVICDTDPSALHIAQTYIMGMGFGNVTTQPIHTGE